MVDMRPLLTVHDDAVAAAGRARRSGARAEMTRRAAAECHAVRMSVVHVTDIDEFVGAVAVAVGHDVLVAEPGPVVGIHAGPGAVGLAYQRA
jgi:fatty acid-binding protein DegV